MKQKTNKTLSKRVKITARKKLLHGHALTSHNRSKKTKRRMRRQAEPAIFTKGFDKKIRKMLGI